jgi:hypothetical protein
MELLLHADFVEFGRSGTRYSRTDVLRKFADKGLPAISFCNVEVAVLAEDVALLTYLSADADGNPQTLRSSTHSPTPRVGHPHKSRTGHRLQSDASYLPRKVALFRPYTRFGAGRPLSTQKNPEVFGLAEIPAPLGPVLA